MGSFWKTILIAILIFYAFNMITKLVFKRKLKRLQQQMDPSSPDEPKAKTDENKNPHVDPNIGEYTDFEEIKETINHDEE
jgi:hypothetical protein